MHLTRFERVTLGHTFVRRACAPPFLYVLFDTVRYPILR